MDSNFRAVECGLERGAFRTELVFTVELANKDYYSGIAPIHFCWTVKGETIGVNASPVQGGWKGLLAVQFAREDKRSGTAIVEVPDGALICVKKKSLHRCPNEVAPPHVSFKQGS